MKTKQEQIEEMQKVICDNCKYKYPRKGYVCPWQDKDTKCYNCEKLSEALYNVGYRKTPDDIRELIDVLAEGANIKEKLDEIKRLKEENACLLKACEGQFTFDTTQNGTYSIFNSVRKDFAEKAKAKSEMFLVAKGDGVYGEKPYVSTEEIDELLKEYE